MRLTHCLLCERPGGVKHVYKVFPQRSIAPNKFARRAVWVVVFAAFGSLSRFVGLSFLRLILGTRK